MKVVILAAGRGTRFGKITEKTPKSLLKVSGKPILEYTLSSLPSSIKEAFVIIGHLGHKIRNHFGNEYGGRKINYINIAELSGTGGTLWQAKPFLEKNGRFMVLNGDDIYSKGELAKLTNHNWAFGLTKTIPPNPKYLAIQLDKNGNINHARYPTEKEMEKGILIGTGAYVLDHNIFKYKLVPIAKGKEYGLPQTILKAIKKYPAKGVLMKSWLQINYPEDIKKAEISRQR